MALQPPSDVVIQCLLILTTKFWRFCIECQPCWLHVWWWDYKPCICRPKGDQNSFHLAAIQRSIMCGMLRAQIVHTAKQIKRMCRQHIELSSVKYACKPSEDVSLVLFWWWIVQFCAHDNMFTRNLDSGKWCLCVSSAVVICYHPWESDVCFIFLFPQSVDS